MTLPSYQIINADCLDAMRAMEAASVDAVVTDPPYGLLFMGSKWDHGVPGVPFWTEALRVAKPGAHLLAFGGTRTFHRLACAIEDAGWVIRDCIMWVYGSGFPKSHNLDGDWDGWGTALKPAWEPIIVARKPLCGTVAENVARYGTGALNVDGCRVELCGDVKVGGFGSGKIGFNGGDARGAKWTSDTLGRWPANLCHDGSPEVMAGFPESEGQIGGNNDPNGSLGYRGGARGISLPGIPDSGSAARFFYCAKASREDREAGLREAGRSTMGDGIGMQPAQSILSRNTHPTVKPTDLMRWLVRLVTPPGGLVLDPFCGSGSTGKAAILEDRRFVGCELSPEYAEIARARCAHAAASHTPDLFNAAVQP